jgi:hypothetical protein
MKARRLIDGASFGPQTLKVVGAAFDAAWDEVAWSVNKDDPLAVESARLCLADAIFSVAHEGAIDVEPLKKGALEVLAGKYSIPANQKAKPQNSE